LDVDGASASVSRPTQNESGLSTSIASLVEVAGKLEGVLPTEPPYDRLLDEGGIRPMSSERTLDEDLPVGVGDPDPTASTFAGPQAPEVEVRILGPIEIVGAARPFTRAWAAELVVYLAMHRNGASSDQWATALWPDRIMAAASLHSTASAARRSLGTSVEGGDHLPRAHGRLTLAPTVGSDWYRFVALSEREDPSSWRDAIELIRGRPFEGLKAPDWVLLEGIAANVEAVVVDLVSRYSEFCLSSGDPGGAEWSARQGLRVSAYDERLYRILLRAADAAGNPAGVESAMAELVRLVAEDVEPFDAVHPETLELYRTLSRRPPSFVNP
jgi:DNA-binding SARP family transcriptional activator